MTTDALLGYFHAGVLGVFPGRLVWGYITGVQLGDYWDTSWGTTEGTLLKYYSGTARARATTGGLQGR